MIKIIPTTPEHLAQIELRECFAGEERPTQAPNAVTMIVDGVPIAIFGGYRVGSGIYQLWGLVSDRVKDYPASFHRCVKLMLNYHIDSLKLRRVQLSVKVGFVVGWKWAKSLGFACEGIMKSYGPDGSDYWLFARVS